MEREPIFNFEKDLADPEALDADDSGKSETRKARPELLTKRSGESDRRSRDNAPNVKRAGETLLIALRKDEAARPAGEAAAKATTLEELPTADPEALIMPTEEFENAFREDAIEKLDQPQDAGGLMGGAAPIEQEDHSGHQHAVGPAVAHDPAARSVSQARQQAQQASKQATRKAHRDLVLVFAMIVFVVAGLAYFMTR